MATTDAPRRGQAHAVHLGAEAVAASTAYVLVDLSDTTNYPHRESNWLNLLGCVLSAETHSDGQFDLWIGAVTENDGTNGSADWVHCFHVQNRDNATDDTGHFYSHADFTLGGAFPDGIKLKVASDEYTDFATNQSQDDNTNWQNDTNRVSPTGNVKPAVGDLVLWVEETADAGTLDFSLTVFYEAH